MFEEIPEKSQIGPLSCCHIAVFCHVSFMVLRITFLVWSTTCVKTKIYLKNSKFVTDINDANDIKYNISHSLYDSSSTIISIRFDFAQKPTPVLDQIPFC